MSRPQTGWRIRPEVHQRVQEAAKERGVSSAWLASKLLEEALDMMKPLNEFKLVRQSEEEDDPVAAALGC